jgi:hypothetical protein
VNDDEKDISRDSCNSSLWGISSMTIAVKFCGGCNPTYERLQYWERIKKAAAGRINWVGHDHPGLDGVLLISGCHTSCPEKNFNPADYRRFIVVRDEQTDPEQIINKLLA